MKRTSTNRLVNRIGWLIASLVILPVGGANAAKVLCRDNATNQNGICATPIFDSASTWSLKANTGLGGDGLSFGWGWTLSEAYEALRVDSGGGDWSWIGVPPFIRDVYDWNFAPNHSHYSAPGQLEAFFYRSWNCPRGFTKKMVGGVTPIQPSSANGFPCFKPIVKRFGGACVGDPVKVFENAVYEREVDYQSPGRKLSFSRSYVSNGEQVDTPYLGNGWSSTYFGSLQSGLFDQPTATFESDNGTPKYFSNVAGAWISSSPFDKNGLIEIKSGAVTTGWRYSDNESQSIKVLDGSGRRISEIYSNGSSLVYEYSNAATPISQAPWPNLLISVSDDYGRVIYFNYDEFGHVRALIDPSGAQILYTYNIPAHYTELSDLQSVQYQDGTTRQYVYESTLGVPGLLAAVTDENGNQISAFSYAIDFNGPYVTGSQQAGGVNNFTFSRFNGTSTVIDPLGASRQYSATFIYSGVDTKIEEASRSQPGGSGCLASTSQQTYDANGNVASLDDFNGSRVCRAYDLSRNVETARVEGLAGGSGGVECSGVIAGAATLPAGSRKISTAWHPDWRLVTRMAEPAKVTTSIYNGQPDPFNANVAASCAPVGAVLPDGKPISVLCKRVEQATTDGDGHLGFGATLQAGVANRVSSWTYNQLGQILTEKGPRTDVNDTTTYAYYADTTIDHTRGDLQTVTSALGRVTSYTKYNKHGQVLEMSDPNGVLTVNTYDLRQRPLSTTVGGLEVARTYDAAGQLKTVTLPDSSTLTYTYDAAHRLIAVTDAAGNLTSYTLDNAGNRIGEQVMNAAQQITRSVTRRYDALGRLQSVTGAPN